MTRYACWLLVLMVAPVAAATLYVASDGRDGWSGALARPNAARSDGPLASLQGARNALRRLKAAGPLTEPVRVVVAGGEYRLSSPVVFTPEDSGTLQCPISYEAAPGATPVFSGGRKISGWQPGPGGLWTARAPAGLRFEQLYVNGHWAVRARTPNVVWHGLTPVPRYFYVSAKVRTLTDPVTGKREDVTRRAFRANPADLAGLADVPPDQLNDVTLVAYHAWEASRHRVQSVDLRTGQVVLTGNAPWVFQWLSPDQRYHLENYRAALDAPGEWYLDREGTVYYRPLPGETPSEVVAPVVESFVHFRGDASAGMPVEHITLQGLAFRYAHYLLPPEGHGDGQAAVSVPAVVMADGARNVALRGCEIGYVGTYGVWFRQGCRDCRIERCHLHDLGAGGVKIGQPYIDARAEEQTHQIVCDNNLIHAGGRLFCGAVGVWIGQSGDNQVTHNDVSDLFYSGVSAGWSWGYNPTLSHRNHVDFNHLHHLGWGVMSDMGGVYTLGEADGTTVNNNVIHDVWSYDLYGWGGLGLYNDEGTTHITMANNLVYATRDMTYHQHYGKENMVRNNLLLGGRDSQLSVHRVEPHLSVTFEDNLVVFRSGKLFWQSELGQRQLRFDHNLYWNPTGAPFDFMGLSFADWQKRGLDVNSVIADPRFVDFDRGDYTLRPDSPALKLGFVPFDWRQAGLSTDNPLRRAAEGLRYAPVQFAPNPPARPPQPISDDFESYAPGEKPDAPQVNVENQGDAIAVSADTAAGGKQSLKFTDRADLKYYFDPHLVHTLKGETGTARCAFDVRLEAGAELWHEWRDWSVNPYLTGPSLLISEGKLKVHDQELMPCPVGQWVHVEIVTTLGDKSTGTWDLTVTVPGQEPRRFTGLAFGSAAWRKLTWIGFVSSAKADCVWYLDNVKAALTP